MAVLARLIDVEGVMRVLERRNRAAAAGNLGDQPLDQHPGASCRLCQHVAGLGEIRGSADIEEGVGVRELGASTAVRSGPGDDLA
jgi:hypothetical protein